MADYVKVKLLIDQIGKSATLSKEKVKALGTELARGSENLITINAVTNALSKRLEILDELARAEMALRDEEAKTIANRKVVIGEKPKKESGAIYGAAEDVDIQSAKEYRKKAQELIRELNTLEKQSAKLKTAISKINPADSAGLDDLKRKAYDVKLEMDRVIRTFENINISKLTGDSGLTGKSYVALLHNFYQ